MGPKLALCHHHWILVKLVALGIVVITMADTIMLYVVCLSLEVIAPAYREHDSTRTNTADHHNDILVQWNFWDKNYPGIYVLSVGCLRKWFSGNFEAKIGPATYVLPIGPL